MEPSLYNAGPHPTLWDVQPDRDRDEIMVARWAAADAKPLMGICRGIQVIAVATGGSLIQDIPSQVQDAVPHRQPGEPGCKRSESQLVHAVALTPASRLARIVGADTIWVNSSHHQAVEAVPAPWEVTGRSSDGVIEAIEHRDHPFQVGVEWHPEALTDGQEWAARIFATFVQACRDAGTTASAGCGAPSPHRPAR